ncbi:MULTISPECIES: hypothetical protein [Pseudomonas syringae group]|nr:MULTISPECIES: hypothetical protein [Pseudomonas syringae group]
MAKAQVVAIQRNQAREVCNQKETARRGIVGVQIRRTGRDCGFHISKSAVFRALNSQMEYCMLCANSLEALKNKGWNELFRRVDVDRATACRMTIAGATAELECRFLALF